MRLKKLEIIGFKSFADKTVLDFSNGVVAVVGPNGSGKSNIADAVKWVLGEQSMKNLRAKKSEDLIFTGGNKKSRMSFASVSIYLDNFTDKTFSDQENSTTITRKLYRNGENEYLINKNRVRLSDIISLLANLGISQKGYCIVNQGMADSILTSTSSERMVVFEEAAGVRIFKIKKQQALNKLESTKRNLQRVEDLLLEVEPRLNILKRQINKANKRSEMENKLKSEQKKLFAFMWNKITKENKEHRKREKNFMTEIKKLSKEISEINNQFSDSENVNSNYQANFDKLQKEASSIFETINDFRKNLSEAEIEIRFEREKIKKLLKPELEQINISYVRKRLYEIYCGYEKFFDLLKKLSSISEIEFVKKIGMNVMKNIKSLLDDVRKGKIKIDAKKIDIDKSRLEKLESNRKVISDEIQNLEERYKKIRSKLRELNEKDRKKRELFFSLEKNLRIKRNKMDYLKDSLNMTKVELAKFEVRKEDLINEIGKEIENKEFLDKVQSGKFKFEYNEKKEYFEIEESRSKIRKMKLQLDQIGGIDPLVFEEYKETKKRFDFLLSQSNDLNKAVESLKEVISELDKKTNYIFKSSFKKINEEFKRYFRIIFGGGKASLSVIHSENADSEIKAEKISGIDINISLPKKKINSLNMLSGGERTLVSIAILLAIIANNPPPFSVLDEIDAALDESNSARFAKIIKEGSSKTQFIIITHNREIMKQANVLYGVTMLEEGVSKIISLKLNGIKE